MQDCRYELPRIPIPRTRVNKGKRKSREFSPALLSSVLAPLLAAYSLSLSLVVHSYFFGPVVNVHCLGWLPLFGF
jgi:hypothetical protein